MPVVLLDLSPAFPSLQDYTFAENLANKTSSHLVLSGITIFSARQTPCSSQH
ncbi:MAG: hypothetical protein ACTS73_05840 [Arsenophonus sp. NEOnobi-MAG3]